MGGDSGALFFSFDVESESESVVGTTSGQMIDLGLNAALSSSLFSGTALQPTACQCLVAIRF